MNLQTLTHQVAAVATATREALRLARKGLISPQEVSLKGQSDFVTRFDTLSEKLLVEQLTKLLPEAGFIAEENTETRRGERYNWVIDPIDGTTNFIHNLAPHAISIALQDKEKIVLGVVLELVHNELFCAWTGGGAWLNGEAIRVAETRGHDHALVATGLPFRDFSFVDTYLATLKEVMATTSGVRRLGAAAIDLCYVACGRFDGFWEQGLSPWDMAAGSCIVQEAGGIVGDFQGGVDYLRSGKIIAASTNYYPQFSQLIRKHQAA